MFESGHLPEESPASSARKPTARSRVTNGKELLANIDGRSTEARQVSRLVLFVRGRLRRGGRLTEVQRALVRQAAALTVQWEALRGG